MSAPRKRARPARPEPAAEAPQEAGEPSPHAELARVLGLAYEQSAGGKGADRHMTIRGIETPFHEQPLVRISEMVGPGFCAGQAMKKLHEATELPDVERAKAEALGAIVYCAAFYLLLEKGVRR